MSELSFDITKGQFPELHVFACTFWISGFCIIRDRSKGANKSENSCLIYFILVNTVRRL